MFDENTRGSENRIHCKLQTRVFHLRGAIVFPSRRKATCKMFAFLIYYKNQFGWHCNERDPFSVSATLPPLQGDKTLALEPAMKTILLFSILLCAIAVPAIGELTDADLNKIRLIVREEIKASETRMKEYIDLKLENVSTEFKRIDSRIDNQIKRVDDQVKTTDSQIGYMRNLFIGIVGLPLVIITALFAWRAFRDRANDKQIQAIMADLDIQKSQQADPS